MYVLAHNLQAQMSGRQLNINVKEKGKSSEKLSSGYRINRAADDAAGLAISEKTRRMIRGLNQGEENIQDGISLCQTADGALDEVTQILQRARELSIKAYNGTNSDGDRQIIQDEINQIFEEVDHIRESAVFNEIPLLKGNPKMSTTITEVTETTREKTDIVRLRQEMPSWLEINGKNKDNSVITIQGVTPGGAPTQYTVKGFQIAVNPAYDQKQEITNKDIMYVPNPNNTGEYIYYGPDIGDHNIYTGVTARWAGDICLDPVTGQYNGPGATANWSGTLADNATAKIDFRGLIQGSSNVDSLYQNLFQLIGTQIGVPCGTCRQNIEGIRFSAREFGMTVNQFGPSGGGVQHESYSEINMSDVRFQYAGRTYSGYFDAIEEMQKSHATGTKTAAEKEAETKDLAQAIAKSLADTAYTKLKTDMNTHFDRVDRFKSKDAAGNEVVDEYALIIYDYRDMDKLANDYDANASIITTSADLTCTVKYYETERHENSYKVYTGHPVQIIASGEVYDNIPIDLPDISSRSLNLVGYDITRYSIKAEYGEISEADQAAYEAACQAYEKECEKINSEYRKELQEYNAEWNEWFRNNRKEEISYEPHTSTHQVLVKPAEYGYNDKGERVQISPPQYDTVTSTVMVPVTNLIITGNDPEPQRPQQPKMPAKPQEPMALISVSRRYDPSSVQILDDAIARVCRARADIGARQNRLEHAYAYDCNAEENLQAAEARIRDTDMATEMMKYAKYNILEQFGQSVLVQANHGKDKVTELLQGI